MTCESSCVGDDTVSLLGSYPAPSGPDRGWRIEIEQPEHTRLVSRMTNISPDHEESLAVLAELMRTNEVQQQTLEIRSMGATRLEK